MTVLLYIWLALFHPPSAAEVEALRVTAPDYLTTESAAVHLVAARAAGAVHSVDPTVLLSIAYHESRYVPTTRTPEPGHRVSCGVMTPVPQASCYSWELTILGGYDAGAAHLALWHSYYPGRELLAYAGGGWLVGVCTKDPKNAACDVEHYFRWRASWIAKNLKIVGAQH